MRIKFKRCLTFMLCLLFFSSQITFPVQAADLPMDCDLWDYILIYGEELPPDPETIIIYLHGDNIRGTKKEDLERFATVEHPLKYARADEIPIPDNAMLICPLAEFDGQFRTEENNLGGFILFVRLMYPEAKIILAGASHGSLAAYNMAASFNEDVDGYVFISGIRPGEAEKLSTIRNCMVVFGDEHWLSKRGDYSNLFLKEDITDSKFAKESLHWEEETNNLYVRGPWTHHNTPLVFTEDFFWEWVTNLSSIDE